jgi:ketosteroid isomerase-like protein
MSATAAAAARRLYDAFNRRDIDAWLAAFAPSATWHEIPSGEVFDVPDGVRLYYERFATAFPDGRCTDIVVRDGDGFAVGEFTGSGTNTGPLQTPEGELPPTGKRIDIPFCDVHVVEHGLVVRTHRYWDTGTFARQMGA